ncbi:MAG: hypothetical protein H0T42_27095, partial [Deltaproteobacteria bacterium]|nr:hypothetical protein [Deltaproteobacteria bacterium]
MASKAGQPEGEKVDIEEALDYVDKTLDRTKVMYEQYFLGMQKQPPTQIHSDVERRLRDLQQMSIRNTGLRYRFATLQQKFGSYNSYWRRTLRQIENGTYIRNLQKISRQAALSGEAIPEEILAAMPKRMREQVKRDREQAIAIANRRNSTGTDDGMGFEDNDAGAVIGESPEVVRQIPRGGAQVLDEDDGDLDFEAFFASMSSDDAPPAPRATEPVAVQSRGTGSVPAGAPKPSTPLPMPAGTQPPQQPVMQPGVVASPLPRHQTQPGVVASPLPRHQTQPGVVASPLPRSVTQPGVVTSPLPRPVTQPGISGTPAAKAPGPPPPP